MSWTPPDEGLCSVCEETVRLRRDGRIFKHPKPYDPDASITGTITANGIEWHTQCGGSGQQPAARLEMTFARWLHAHVKRRDARDNPVTFLAQWIYRPCTCSPGRTPADVSWRTVEELHDLRHGDKPACDWLCRSIRQAGERHETYAAVQGLK